MSRIHLYSRRNLLRLRLFSLPSALLLLANTQEAGCADPKTTQKVVANPRSGKKGLLRSLVLETRRKDVIHDPIRYRSGNA